MVSVTVWDPALCGSQAVTLTIRKNFVRMLQAEAANAFGK